jgi:MoCo/4Fe-4S cofactor protein with predicted Tat translocation signal
MPSLNDNGQSGVNHWRSLEHLAETEEFREFLHREFPAGASEMLESTDRRQFLKVMGASMALAGLGIAGCRRWPEEKIVPHAHRPEHRDPGVPAAYASCMELGGVARGVLVKSFDGRPVKVEGNPDHPTSLGAADCFAQASVLDLYDPDRSRGVLKDGAASSFAAFETWATEHFGALANSGGRGLAVLSERIGSPSMIALKETFRRRFPEARWVEYEPLREDQVARGAEMAFGEALRTQLDLAHAKTIVALDADILGVHPDAVRNIRGFAESRRKVDEDAKAMSRLYAVESDLSLTGSNADVRIAMKSMSVGDAALHLARRLLGEGVVTAEPGGLTDGQVEILDTMAAELEAHHGESVVAVGPRQPAAVHYLAHLMNEHLGNIGRTVRCTKLANPPQLDAVSGLMLEPAETLVIVGGNPVYASPNELAEVVDKATHTVHLSDYVDETSAKCGWHVNRAHYLEAWGDGTAYDGTHTLGQPLIEPMFKGVSAIELMALLAGDDVRDGEAIVRRASGLNDDKAWRTALQDGFIRDSAGRLLTPSVDRNGLAQIAQSLDVRGRDQAGYEVVLAAHPSVYDGRFANNGWLQELPDALTKLTWDNAVIMSPALFEKLGLEYDGTDQTTSMVTVSVDGKSITAAAHRLPGLPDDSVTLHLGYGRRFEGRICAGAGFDFGALRGREAMDFIGGAMIEAVDERYVLATTQDHHWGMAIDLNACTAATRASWRARRRTTSRSSARTRSAGPRDALDPRGPVLQVRKGRSSDQFDAERCEVRALQPVVCVHCENAPCEQVCPVAATVHDKDGLNVMVYNRCIGTRYCSNNCPYKVRRFNYFDYHRREPPRTADGFDAGGAGVLHEAAGDAGRVEADAVQPRGHGARARRDGEVHVLHSAHRGREDQRQERVRPAADGR